MMPVMPVLANGGTYITVKARDVVNVAHNAIAVWALLIIAGHPILATFKVASFLVTCILIGIARRLYRERLGLKSEDDTE